MYCIRHLATACCLITISFSLFAEVAGKQPVSDKGVVKQSSAVKLLTEKLQGMSSLQAQFSQHIKDKKGRVLQPASGTVSVKRPRRFHWNTTQPYEHLLVTDGSVLWLYDIDLEQVSRQTFSADLGRVPALLLSGEVEQIANQYHVRLLPTSKNSDSNTSANKRSKTAFELKPISKSGLFSRLTISFDDNKISSMSLLDSFDQHTEIEFSQVVLNPSIDDTFFLFTPPKGVDVIIND